MEIIEVLLTEEHIASLPTTKTWDFPNPYDNGIKEIVFSITPYSVADIKVVFANSN